MLTETHTPEQQLIILFISAAQNTRLTHTHTHTARFSAHTVALNGHAHTRKRTLRPNAFTKFVQTFYAHTVLVLYLCVCECECVLYVECHWRKLKRT